MKTDTEVKCCKNKDCKKPLPIDYKYKYCEACRNKRVDKVKNAGKRALEVVGSLACVAVALLVKGNNSSKD